MFMITVMLYIVIYGASDEAVGRFLFMYILGILFFNHEILYEDSYNICLPGKRRL